MPARNEIDSFGWISRTLHWTMAALILGMLGFGTYLSGMQPSLENLWLYGLHKSIGLMLLSMVLFRILWHRVSAPPASLTAGIPRWQQRAVSLTHKTIYLLLVAVPLTGWIASAATGIDVIVFNLLTIPRIAPVSEAWETGFFAAHSLLTSLLMIVVTLHVAGALARHFLHKDATLRRMLRG